MKCITRILLMMVMSRTALSATAETGATVWTPATLDTPGQLQSASLR
jgi:hypothetical protein